MLYGNGSGSHWGIKMSMMSWQIAAPNSSYPAASFLIRMIRTALVQICQKVSFVLATVKHCIIQTVFVCRTSCCHWGTALYTLQLTWWCGLAECLRGASRGSSWSLERRALQVCISLAKLIATALSLWEWSWLTGSSGLWRFRTCQGNSGSGDRCSFAPAARPSPVHGSESVARPSSPILSRLLCEWCRLKKCHASQKCHVSDYPVEWSGFLETQQRAKALEGVGAASATHDHIIITLGVCTQCPRTILLQNCNLCLLLLAKRSCRMQTRPIMAAEAKTKGLKSPTWVVQCPPQWCWSPWTFVIKWMDRGGV